MSNGITVKNLETSDNTREFVDGSSRASELLNSVAIGLGTYQPGWRWSLHAGPQNGKPSANHIAYILSGKLIVRDASGNEKTVGLGEAFEVGPNHDAWVDGNEPCVALDFSNLGAGTNAL